MLARRGLSCENVPQPILLHTRPAPSRPICTGFPSLHRPSTSARRSPVDGHASNLGSVETPRIALPAKSPLPIAQDPEIRNQLRFDTTGVVADRIVLLVITGQARRTWDSHKGRVIFRLARTPTPVRCRAQCLGHVQTCPVGKTCVRQGPCSWAATGTLDLWCSQSTIISSTCLLRLCKFLKRGKRRVATLWCEASQVPPYSPKTRADGRSDRLFHRMTDVGTDTRPMT